MFFKPIIIKKDVEVVQEVLMWLAKQLAQSENFVWKENAEAISFQSSERKLPERFRG